MSEQKHTPGPWGFSCEENNGWKGHTFSVQISAGETLIASYDTSYVEYPEADVTNEANARLIAAAPDLLEALDWLVQILPDPELDNDELQRTWTKKARAAIAKATGVPQ